MRISTLSPALGALVDDIDLRGGLGDAEWTSLREALFERHHLLLFRDQDLTDDEHVEVLAHFGPIAMEGLAEAKAVGVVSNHRRDGSLGSSAASWHIDYGFFEHPYEAISLYGLELPASATETWFVNAIRAAVDMPDDLRSRIAPLSARQAVDVSSAAGQSGVRFRLGRLDETYPHFTRPVLWPHHVTGEPILGVWEQQTDALLPLEADESDALIEELFAHLYREEHRYVHRWEPGDLVIWDNHALQHSRPDVGVEAPRTLRRVCVGRTQDLSIFAARKAAY